MATEILDAGGAVAEVAVPVLHCLHEVELWRGERCPPKQRRLRMPHARQVATGEGDLRAAAIAERVIEVLEHASQRPARKPCALLEANSEVALHIGGKTPAHLQERGDAMALSKALYEAAHHVGRDALDAGERADVRLGSPYPLRDGTEIDGKRVRRFRFRHAHRLCAERDQRPQELLGVRVARIEVRGERTPHHGFERGGDVPAKHAHGRWIAAQHAGEKLGQTARIERTMARKYFVEHHAHRVDVDPRIAALVSAELLGARVVGGGHGVARRREVEHVLPLGGRLDERADAEVEDFHKVRIAVAWREKHVFGFEVAVHDPARVRRVEGIEHLPEHVGGALHGEGPLLAEHLLQRTAAYVLHDEKRRAGAFLTHVEYVDDVGMSHSDRDAGLALEALEHHAVVGETVMEKLEGHRLPDGGVLGFEHGAHPTAPHHTQQPVFARDERTEQSAFVGQTGGSRQFPCGVIGHGAPAEYPFR